MARQGKNRRPEPFRPPTDIKQWWCAPHCGPGTKDAKEVCGYCGRNVIECASTMSDHISRGDLDDCGGSGFWCQGCGRFWAQDSCGESAFEQHRAADGARLVVAGRGVGCVCGKFLFNIPEEGD